MAMLTLYAKFCDEVDQVINNPSSASKGLEQVATEVRVVATSLLKEFPPPGSLAAFEIGADETLSKHICGLAKCLTKLKQAHVSGCSVDDTHVNESDSAVTEVIANEHVTESMADVNIAESRTVEETELEHEQIKVHEKEQDYEQQPKKTESDDALLSSLQQQQQQQQQQHHQQQQQQQHQQHRQQQPSPTSQHIATFEVAINALAPMLRLCRNACVQGNEVQCEMKPLLIPLGALLLSCLKNRCQSETEDNTPPHPTTPFITVGIQLLGNSIVGNQVMQQAVWELGLSNFEGLLMHTDGKNCNTACMVLYNCVVQSDARLLELVNTDAGWRAGLIILERFDVLSQPDADTPCEFLGYLIQHVITSDVFHELYNGLGKLVSGPKQKIPRGELAKVVLLKSVYALITECEGKGELDIPAANIKFIIERFRLLAYLGYDESWWGEPASQCHAAVLATLIAMMGDISLVGKKFQTVLGKLRVLESAIEMLQKINNWPKPKRDGKKRKATQTQVPANGSDVHGLTTAFCVKRDLVRLIALLVFRHKVRF